MDGTGGNQTAGSERVANGGGAATGLGCATHGRRAGCPGTRPDVVGWALGELTGTQLVNLSPDGLDFALPILRQWFAFAALMEGEIPVEYVAGDPARLDRWTDVIATAVELAPDEAALDHLLVPIARSSPGVASLVLAVLDEAVEEAVRDGEVGSVPVEGIGTQLRQAMSAFPGWPWAHRAGDRPGTGDRPAEAIGHRKSGRSVPDGVVRRRSART